MVLMDRLTLSDTWTLHSTSILKLNAEDWLIELKFNVPLDTKYVLLETLCPANLLAATGKIKIKAGRKKP